MIYGLGMIGYCCILYSEFRVMLGVWGASLAGFWVFIWAVWRVMHLNEEG
ncbi:MAG: hypothetical protein ACTSWK_17650 [Promethearchaeota archaeon]